MTYGAQTCLPTKPVDATKIINTWCLKKYQTFISVLSITPLLFVCLFSQVTTPLHPFHLHPRSLRRWWPSVDGSSCCRWCSIGGSLAWQAGWTGPRYDLKQDHDLYSTTVLLGKFCSLGSLRFPVSQERCEMLSLTWKLLIFISFRSFFFWHHHRVCNRNMMQFLTYRDCFGWSAYFLRKLGSHLSTHQAGGWVNFLVRTPLEISGGSARLL